MTLQRKEVPGWWRSLTTLTSLFPEREGYWMKQIAYESNITLGRGKKFIDDALKLIRIAFFMPRIKRVEDSGGNVRFLGMKT